MAHKTFRIDKFGKKIHGTFRDSNINFHIKLGRTPRHGFIDLNLPYEMGMDKAINFVHSGLAKFLNSSNFDMSEFNTHWTYSIPPVVCFPN